MVYRRENITVETPLNSQNDHVYAQATRKRGVSPVRLIRDRQHFSQKGMVSVGVSRMGKTGVVFVEQGAKVNSECYCRQHVLDGGLLPDIRARCQRYSWTLQQDGAPSHTARNTLTYLRRETENVTFTEPDMWPPHSPDLNPVDHAVRDALQQMVYQRRRFTTINQLKQAIVIEWGKLLQRFIDRAIGH